MSTFSPTSIMRHVTFALALAAAFAAPAAARAQDASAVYSGAELTTPPKLANMTATARLVEKSYPDNLRRQGVSGTVQVQFVVGPDGKVEDNSVEVVAATRPELGEAAKQVANKIEFKPGTIKGTAVRTRVVLPITYKP